MDGTAFVVKRLDKEAVLVLEGEDVLKKIVAAVCFPFCLLRLALFEDDFKDPQHLGPEHMRK